jgi:hypothetical protein
VLVVWIDNVSKRKSRNAPWEIGTAEKQLSLLTTK